MAPSRFDAVLLVSEGMGDCLVAMAVIRKMASFARFAVVTHHPGLFAACPYVTHAMHIRDEGAWRDLRVLRMFEPARLPYHAMDTFDFLSVPLGLGTLTLREKRLEYFPVEPDGARPFDVVINTSTSWPCRSWPLSSWQALADHLRARGRSVAVVGKDVASEADRMNKRARRLEGCVDLTNSLTLDQTWHHIRKCGVFVSCQNGLSVLAGSTDAEIVVLDRSTDWSRYAIYREENPHHKFTLVRGGCDIYCGEHHACERFGEFRCIPGVDAVLRTVDARLEACVRP